MILTKELFETQWAENTLTTTDWFDTTWALFKELEEAMKPKTCHWCKQSWEPNNQTFHRYFCNYLRIPVHGNFYCNRYEPKDNA